jgi:hypothetical protein
MNFPQKFVTSTVCGFQLETRGDYPVVVCGQNGFFLRGSVIIVHGSTMDDVKILCQQLRKSLGEDGVGLHFRLTFP